MRYVPSWRDRVAHRLGNLALRIGSPTYQALIKGALQYGIRAAARDHREGIPKPPPVPTSEGNDQ